MHKFSAGGRLAAVCSLVLAVAAQAGSVHKAMPRSGNILPGVFVKAGSNSHRNLAVSRDKFESGRVLSDSSPIEYDDAIDASRSQVEFGPEYNHDTGDPFYYAIPSAAESRDIFSVPFYYPSFESRVPGLAQADIFDIGTNGDVFKSGANAEQAQNNGGNTLSQSDANAAGNSAQAPSLQGSTNGTIGPGPGQDIYIPDGPNGDIFAWLAGDPFEHLRSDQQNRFGNTLSQSNAQGKDRFLTRIANSHPTAAAKPVSGWKYNPSQPRWEPNRLPIKIYISGYVEAARGGLVREAITSALRQWSQASNGAIRYQITSRYCDADVHFVDGLTDDHEFAQTCVDYHKGPIDHAKVIFLISTLTKLPEAQVKGLCLHEIGHVFGILRHSKNERDAMSEMAIDEVHPITLLSQKDKHVMAALYRRWDVSDNVSLRVASAVSGRSLQTK